MFGPKSRTVPLVYFSFMSSSVFCASSIDQDDQLHQNYMTLNLKKPNVDSVTGVGDEHVLNNSANFDAL